MSSKQTVTIAALIVSALLAPSVHGFGWGLVNAKIRHDFPAVKWITTSELAAWLADKERPAPLLLDVRTQAEYDVSHLPKAERVEPDSSPATVQQPKDRPIVTYCSIGYRSGAFAQKLTAAGFTNVLNLEGSIFAWANEGRPVLREGVRVAQVHPYNRAWGLLLRKEYRVALPVVEKRQP